MSRHQEQIRNLLSLAAGASNETEAANAYAAAQKLMTRHAIQACELAEPSEIVSEDLYIAPGAYMPSWLVGLAQSLATASKCTAHSCTRRRRSAPSKHPECYIQVWGPRVQLAEIRSMFDHVREQIDRRAKVAREAVGKDGKRAFRFGAVGRIDERISAAAEQAEREAQAATRQLPAGPAQDVATTALALYGGQLARVDAAREAAWTAAGIKRTHGTTAPVSDYDAYHAGRRAADNMSLSARKALTAG